MNEKTKSTLGQRIVKALGTSHGLTRGQLMTKLGTTRDTIRKPISKLLEEGTIKRVIDASGVETFNLGKMPSSRVVETSVIKDMDFSLDELGIPQERIDAFTNKMLYGKADLPTSEAAEHIGFAKGYARGVQEAQRSAYEAGKQSVIDKLVGVLR